VIVHYISILFLSYIHFNTTKMEVTKEENTFFFSFFLSFFSLGLSFTESQSVRVRVLRRHLVILAGTNESTNGSIEVLFGEKKSGSRGIGNR
jgi:hypothetical protein